MASTGFIWNIMTSESVVPVQTNRHLDTMPWSSGKTSLFCAMMSWNLAKTDLAHCLCITADTRDNRETIEKLAHLSQDQQTVDFNIVIIVFVYPHTLLLYSVRMLLPGLRWYGTPCNIFKDDRILKNDYNYGFKNFKIYNICPKNAFIKFHKRYKK